MLEENELLNGQLLSEDNINADIFGEDVLTGSLIASGDIVASMVSEKGAKGDKGDKGDAATIAIGTTTTGEPGTQAIVTNSGTSSDAVFNFTIPRGYDGQGSGDMLKSVYDTNDNGIVDNAELVNNHTVLSDVPSDAVFTDTTYTAGTNVSISAGNVISATDTTYTAGTGISISAENVISNTQTSAAWGNITGTLSNQTDLKSALDKKQDLTPTRLTDTSVGTYSNPYILDTMASGYYYIETPSGSSTRYFKLTSSASGSTSISSSATGDGFGFYLYIPKTIDTPNLNNGDVVCYFDRISISSAGSTSGGLICYVYDPSKSPKIGLDSLKSYNRSFGTTVTASAQTWRGIKTFNDVPVCATAPTNNSDLANKKYIDDGLSAKQDTLVSGTNIKTINGTSVLGSGDIDAGASIPIQNTAPLNPEEDDLWIDTSEPEEMQEAIVNEYSESINETYSCDYVNGIIKSGSNANGYYTKYADGTLICRYFVGPLTTEPYSPATLNVTFPSTFSNNEYSCCVSFLDPQAYWGSVNVGCRNKTTTGFTMETWNSSNGQNPNQWFNYIAIGKWK